jgi:hypothetical protein
LFGSYIPESEEETCRYGLVKPIAGYNLFEIELHGWRDLIRDVIHAASMRDALGYLAMPPGWRPNGAGGTTEDLRRQPPQTHALRASA